MKDYLFVKFNCCVPATERYHAKLSTSAGVAVETVMLDNYFPVKYQPVTKTNAEIAEAAARIADKSVWSPNRPVCDDCKHLYKTCSICDTRVHLADIAYEISTGQWHCPKCL